MNRQEAKEPMYELAQKNGLTVYDPETDASRPKGVTLDLEDTISGDAYTSPLATGKLSFQVHVPTGKLDPDENREVSRYYSAMAGMQEEELLKNPPSYDVTPEKKAEFHKRLEALPDLQNGTEAEKAFYQAYTAYHEKYKDAGEDFGFYGASQHQNVAKAMLQAGISEEETASVLASKDPYVVSTDAIPAEEIARRMTAFAASSLVAEQYGKDHKDDTQVVYRSTDLIDDTLEWMQSEQSHRSYEVMGFIVWYADGMGQYDEIPVYTDLLQDLYKRLDAENLLVSPIPEEALDAAQDASDIYALSSRIDTLNPHVQHVVKNWMEEKANYYSFGNEADWYAFQRSSYEDGREDLENLLREQSDRFPIPLVPDSGQKETYAFVNWDDDQVSLKDVESLDDIIDALQDLTYKDADICIEYKPNDIPSLRMDDGTAIIPESRFKEAMEKHPELDQVFQNAIRECDNENDGLRDFYIQNTGRVPASAVQNRISDYLNDDDSLHDDALRANIEDLALNCPMENMVKRFQHAYQENGFRGLSEAWEDSIETPRNVVKTGESFRALEGLYKDMEAIQELPWDERQTAFRKVTEAGRCWNTVMMDLLSINPKDREAAKGVLSAYAKEKGFTNGKG